MERFMYLPKLIQLSQECQGLLKAVSFALNFESVSAVAYCKNILISSKY